MRIKSMLLVGWEGMPGASPPQALCHPSLTEKRHSLRHPTLACGASHGPTISSSGPVHLSPRSCGDSASWTPASQLPVLATRNLDVQLLQLRSGAVLDGDIRTGGKRIGGLGTDPGRGIHVDTGTRSVAGPLLLHDGENGETYRSIHFPSTLNPTRFGSKPHCSKRSVYHGRRAADRKKTRPPSLSTLLRARTCETAACVVSAGSNQSIESMSCGCVSVLVWSVDQCWLTMAMVKVDGVMREMTSMISSVWMRRLSNVPFLDSFEWLFWERYRGAHLCRGQTFWQLSSACLDSLLRIFALQTHVVKVVVSTQLGVFNDRVESIDHVLPDRFSTLFLGLRSPSLLTEII